MVQTDVYSQCQAYVVLIRVNSAKLKKSAKPDVTQDIEDEAAEELVFVDPTNLDRYSYKDCTIGNISKSHKDKIWNILKEHKDVFAKSKLNVGEFKGFLVQIEISKDLPNEQKRYMPPEKLEYCRKTFQTFKKLGLVQRCDNPRRISNLHLVLKSDGLRDLTKDSTYLAQI